MQLRSVHYAMESTCYRPARTSPDKERKPVCLFSMSWSHRGNEIWLTERPQSPTEMVDTVNWVKWTCYLAHVLPRYRSQRTAKQLKQHSRLCAGLTPIKTKGGEWEATECLFTDDGSKTANFRVCSLIYFELDTNSCQVSNKMFDG